MPDLWTSNPEHLRTMLHELGAICGVESRVLKPRDAEWTCTVDSKGWLRDVYIHHATELLYSPYYLSFLLMCTIAGVFLGLLWGKRFWNDV